MNLAPRTATLLTLALASTLLVCVLLLAPGCAVGQIVGGMAESYKRSSTRLVEAEYTGLRGSSFAVIVTGDRVIQGTHPTLLPRLATRITQTLANPADTGVTGFAPVMSILEFQLSRPDWTTWTYEQLAEEFGVDILIVVELYEYRLHEVGNVYLWDGMAAARVGIVEAKGYSPNEYAFFKDIQVRFPDASGMSPQDMSSQVVRTNLEKRFVDRVTWIMFDHQEPYYPDY